MWRGTIYFERENGRDIYSYYIMSAQGKVLDSENGLSRNKIVRVARRNNGYRHHFVNIPEALKEDLRKALR